MSIFYEITAKNGKKSYLYGTIHSNHPEILKLPIEVKKAFEQASSYIFEGNPNDTLFLKMKLKSEWLQKIQKDQTGIAHEQYLQKILEYKKAGIINKNYDPLTSSPICIATHLICRKNIENKDLTPVLDAQLMQQAKNSNQPIYYLENNEEAMASAYGYQFSYQEHLEFFNFIDSYLAKGGELLPGLDKLIELYLAEDSKSLKKLLSITHLINEVPEVIKKYEKAMETDRDIKMANQMKTHLEAGNAFVAVGSAHIEEIIEVLTKDGCVVTPQTISERKYPIYEQKISLGLFGFHPSQAQLQELDPEVKFESTEDGVIARFQNFQKLPSLKTILNFKEDESPAQIFPKNQQLLDSLIKKYNCDIGFFNSSGDIFYIGNKEKMNEYTTTYGT